MRSQANNRDDRDDLARGKNWRVKAKRVAARLDASRLDRVLHWLIPAMVGAAAWLHAAPASAVIVPGDLLIRLEPVASGLPSPIYATHAGDGSGRLFIVDQGGKVLILKNGAILPTPFLDVSSLLPALNAGFDERGLLGLAFHPDYENNGRFFIRHSAPRPGAMGEPCFGTSRGCHEEILAEYHVSADPDVADPNGTILFRVNKPQFNHNGAQVAFGPDGYLYFSLGDGGGANDGLADMPPSHGPIGNGQNIDVPLGKVLRIDVDSGAPYAIPPDNPFVGTSGLDEIYAYGFRNPYRFCFDDGPGGDNRLIVADVGQNLFEEIDVVNAGGNYGWVIKEGFHCFDPFNPNTPLASCDETGLIDPITEYSHAEGGISITGGFIYRGSQYSRLVGKYVFGDFSSAFNMPRGRLYYLDDTTPGAVIKEFKIFPGNRPYGLFLKGFGLDEAGEIYACGSTSLGPFGTGGVVERLVVLASAAPEPIHPDAVEPAE